jgi:hypothetical protein
VPAGVLSEEQAGNAQLAQPLHVLVLAPPAPRVPLSHGRDLHGHLAQLLEVVSQEERRRAAGGNRAQQVLTVSEPAEGHVHVIRHRRPSAAEPLMMSF